MPVIAIKPSTSNSSPRTLASSRAFWVPDPSRDTLSEIASLTVFGAVRFPISSRIQYPSRRDSSPRSMRSFNISTVKNGFPSA
jgi:hypothetical protein